MRRIVLMCAVAMLIACPNPLYRLKFEDNGKLRDQLHIARKQDHVEINLMGWSEYGDTTQYELTLGVEVRFDGDPKSIMVQSDSIRVRYNSTEMGPAGIQTWERENEPDKGKFAFGKKFICSPDISNLPKAADGTVADVRLAISLTGLIQIEGRAVVFDTVVAWERKAKSLTTVP
ncbi:MAG: hypothetical protein WAU88_03920 [Candidatus Zixiibacteriota bacterium]